VATTTRSPGYCTRRPDRGFDNYRRGETSAYEPEARNHGLNGIPTDFQFNVINATDEINDITRSNGLEFRLTTGFRF
jgi:hypothetical protein